MAHQNNHGHQALTPGSKTICCPNCTKKSRSEKNGREGKIGKIIILISKTQKPGESSGTKTSRCPVCRKIVKFIYWLAESGKVKVHVLS